LSIVESWVYGFQGYGGKGGGALFEFEVDSSSSSEISIMSGQIGGEICLSFESGGFGGFGRHD